MSDKTRKLLADADSYLSLLWHRYVPDKYKHDSFRHEIDSLIARLREAYDQAEEWEA